MRRAGPPENTRPPRPTPFGPHRTHSCSLTRNGGQIYNIVDDRPQSFGDYARELSAKLHRPRPLPMPRQLVGLVAPYAATAFGNTWLPLSNAKAKAELGWTPTPR